jgi:hypothetical protein
MMEEIKEILDEGGAKMETIDVVEVVETPEVEEVATEEVVAEDVTEVAEEVAAEEVAETEFAKEEEEEKKEEGNEEKKCSECGKPLDECTCDKEDEKEEDKKKYVLEEVVEYAELQTQYSELQANYEALNTEYANTKAQMEELVAFKKAIEKKEKEAMIKSFYMLSDEDKKEVIDNIDAYSLEDIEAKLSVICVRNKVSFNLDEDNEVDSTTTFSLDADYEDDSVPAWIKSVRATAQEI